jgi:hypothetical protein
MTIEELMTTNLEVPSPPPPPFPSMPSFPSMPPFPGMSPFLDMMNRFIIKVNDSPYNMSSTINNIQINTSTSIINQVKISIDSLILYKSVSFTVYLMSSEYTIVDNKTFTLTDNEYTNWGNNDDYIVNYVLNQFGLTQIITSEST